MLVYKVSMFSLLEKQISIKPNQTSTGTVKTPLEKLFLLTLMGYHKTYADLLFDWEDQYLHLELGAGTLQAAYSKGDEFQFGKLLSQMAGVSQEEIDQAYKKINKEGGEGPAAIGTQLPPSQRIGSILVGAHIISPHMIGTVLRTQIIERTLRILALKNLNFTYEPKIPPKTAEADNYPYLDPTIPMDELLFHAFMWRTQIKIVDSVMEYFLKYGPTIDLDSQFQFSERLAVICRLEPAVMESEFFEPMRSKHASLQDWLQIRPTQRAFTLRFVTAFLLTHIHLWKASSNA